jgi:hypothetical protein
MRTVTPAYAAAIGKSETRPATVVSIVWPAGVVGAPTDFSKLALAVTGQADLTTDAPSGTRLIAGYPTRSATLTLGGAVKDPTGSMMALFDPWSPSSPLYDFDWTGIAGARVVVQQGLWLRGVLVPETYTIMTGYVDGCAIDRDSGVVTLSLLDYRPLLSNVPVLPLMLSATTYYQAAPGLSSLPFIEYILNANGIYAAPQPRPSAVFYATWHGSLWVQLPSPTSIVFAASAQTQTNTPPTWVPGKWAGAVPLQADVVSAVTSPVPFGGAHSVRFEGWVYLDPVPNGSGAFLFINETDTGLIQDRIEIDIVPAAGPQLSVSVSIKRNNAAAVVSGSAVTAGGPGWHQVTIVITWTGANTATVQIWLDGAGPTTFNLVALGNYVRDGKQVEAEAFYNFPIDTWQISVDDPSPNPTVFTPTAFLDGSLNLMTATPAVQDVTDAWGLLQQIADAELATLGFDEDLIFRFKNRRNVPTVPGRVVTSLTAIKALASETIEANRGRTINASVTPYAIQPLAIVWQAAETYVVPARGTLTIFATLTGPTAFVPTGASILINNQAPTAQVGPLNSYRGNTKPDGTGPDTDTLNCVMTQLSATTVKIVITNPANHITYIVSPSLYTDMPAGTASLWLVGYPLNAGAALAAAGAQSVTVSAVYGAGLPAINLPDSQWRQDQPTVQTLCEDVLADYVVPRPQFVTFTIVGDASLQLGDRVTVQDKGELAAVGKPAVPPATMLDDVILTAIHPNVSPDGGFTQDITARLIGRPRGWILGVAGRSELDSTTYI